MNEDEWKKQVKHVLEHWHQVVELGENPLAYLKIVEQQRRKKNLANDVLGRADALRRVLRKVIHALGVEDMQPPAKEDDPAWLTREWRYANILTLLYTQGLPQQEVANRIGLARGGQYEVEKRRAVEMLAAVLRSWEGIPHEQGQTVALVFPSGAMGMTDRFYMERQADVGLIREFQTPLGKTVTIRGARQMGKTSLLLRGANYVRQQHSAKVVYFDLQSVGDECVVSLDALLYQLAESIVRKLELEMAEVKKAWRSRRRAPQKKLEWLLQDYVLPNIHVPIVLALDEVDRLLPSPFRNDFFSMLRAWHTVRAYDEQWRYVSLIFVISTEPYLLIDNVNLSPFNVGLRLYLDDFNQEQVRDLNQRHGSPLPEHELPDLMALLNGHPYLTRVAFYWMIKDKLPWTHLVQVSTTAEGPFGDHLQHFNQLLSNNPSLKQAFKQIVQQKQCTDEQARFRLLKAGLIKNVDAHDACRCELYRRYFADKL